MAGEKEEMSIKNDSWVGELFRAVKKLKNSFFLADQRK